MSFMTKGIVSELGINLSGNTTVKISSNNDYTVKHKDKEYNCFVKVNEQSSSPLQRN